MQKKWSKAEEEYLVDNKGKLSHVEMADTLGKSVSAVNHKMAKLGATKKRTGSRLSEQGKKCSKCLIVKPEEEFSNNKSRIDGKEVWCKNCRAFDLREKKYGMSEEEYRHRVSLQNGKCAICGMGCENLYVDHCHETGRIRSLLCSACNLILGHAQESPKILAAAILYLKRHGKSISMLDNKGAMSAEFLVARNKCCGNSCRNCPWC